VNCRNCTAVLPYGAMFCGECGATVLAPRVVEAPPRPRTSDTVIIQPLPPAYRPAIDPNPVIAVQPVALPSASPIRMPPTPAQTVVESHPAERAAIPDPHAALNAELDDFEATRVVRRGQAGERFVLQFSTGDSATVTGSGLVGRNPVAQPGEAFDQTVVILDPGKSVSKTHLEFGQTNGVFWVSDRFSGNGTIIRQPETDPQRAEAGKRYPVVRGSRIDIAEQFFVVS
jgi:hypothetical protein